MANILVNIEKGVEVGAGDLLKFMSGAQSKLTAAPQVIAALGVVLGAVNAAVVSAEGAAASSGLNIALDEATLAEIKALWPDVVKFLATLGIKV